jgi:phosphoribosyl 1,2-cyclic phosphate phosphodiesterase
MSSLNLEIVFLGTGTSHGVPMINCDCAVCRSEDPHDRRDRCGLAIRTREGKVVLIDTPPELRLEAIACDIRRVDAILFTHSHADHIMGLDDVRRFNDVIRGPIDGYADEGTLRHLRLVFGYAEVSYELVATYRPCLRFHRVDGPFSAAGLSITPIPLLHGQDEVLGFRIGDFAYCTDCSAIPDPSMAMLRGLDLLVLDALRHTPHPTHFNLTGALEIVGLLKPKRTLFTHITHELPHRETNACLPPSVELAYDGLRVNV